MYGNGNYGMLNPYNQFLSSTNGNYNMQQQQPQQQQVQQQQVQQQPQQSNISLIKVNGLEGAKAYPMQPNSTIALFDGVEAVLYIKTTDAGGYPSIMQYNYEPVVEVKAEEKQAMPQIDTKNFMTREEFEQEKQMLMKYFSGVNFQNAEEKKSVETKEEVKPAKDSKIILASK